MDCDWPAVVSAGDFRLHYYFSNALRISCRTTVASQSPGFSRIFEWQDLTGEDHSLSPMTNEVLFVLKLRSQRPEVGEIDVFVHRYRLAGCADIDLHLEADRA